MSTGKRIVIVGATSAIAEHCTKLWAERGDIDEMILVGRLAARLDRVARDLGVRYPSMKTDVVTILDFTDPASVAACVDAAYASGPIDLVLIAQGYLPSQEASQNNLEHCRDALMVNGISPVIWAEAFAGTMAHHNLGTLILLGSVAGDRGRRSNYIYGAAKGLVTRYAEGLQHRFAGTNVKVVLVKPGPTDTPMTAEFKAKGMKLAPVQEVARTIVHGVEFGKQVIYAPAKWGLIMWVICHLPRRIFHRLNI